MTKVLELLPKAAALLILRVPAAKVKFLPAPPKVFTPDKVKAPDPDPLRDRLFAPEMIFEMVIPPVLSMKILLSVALLMTTPIEPV